MPRRQLARKPRPTAERNLRLVPPPRPKRRPKRRWKIGRIRKPKYEDNITLHRYEEEFVLRVITERGGAVTLRELVRSEPERWNTRLLGMTLMRLYKSKRVTAALGHGAHAKVAPFHLTFTIPPKPTIGDKHGR